MPTNIALSITINRPPEIVRACWKNGVGVTRIEPGPAGKGTRMRVTLDHEEPRGLLGKLAATLTGNNPRARLQDKLRAFKQDLEAGEQPTIKGQPRGH